MQNSSSRKRTNDRQGRFKLVVFFKDHRLQRGFTMYSKVGQDRCGVSLERFKNLVLRGRFAGKVKWAGIYERGIQCWTHGMNEE